MSGMSCFDPELTTTWEPSGMSPTQGATTPSGRGNHTTRQPAEYNDTAASRDHNGKRQQQLPTTDMSSTVDPLQLDTRFGPGLDMAPNKKRKYSATSQKLDENYQETLDTGSTYSDQEWWRRDSPIGYPDDEDYQFDHHYHDTPLSNDNAGGACSPVPPQPMMPGHRERNRLAAIKCRAKAKAAEAELETTERDVACSHRRLSAQATSLQDEVLALKHEVLSHGNCDSDIIQQYLTNAARRVIGGGKT